MDMGLVHLMEDYCIFVTWLASRTPKLSSHGGPKIFLSLSPTSFYALCYVYGLVSVKSNAHVGLRSITASGQKGYSPCKVSRDQTS
jgi:hypothetical protein